MHYTDGAPGDRWVEALKGMTDGIGNKKIL